MIQRAFLTLSFLFTVRDNLGRASRWEREEGRKGTINNCITIYDVRYGVGEVFSLSLSLSLGYKTVLLTAVYTSSLGDEIFPTRLVQLIFFLRIFKGVLDIVVYIENVTFNLNTITFQNYIYTNFFIIHQYLNLTMCHLS